MLKYILLLRYITRSGEPALAQEQPQNQDDNNRDSEEVEGIHGVA
jgi:hypothetical protein